MQSKPVIAELASGTLSTIYGDFKMYAFTDGKEEAIILCLGDILGASDILCRIQSECISSHVFFGTICDCREQMAASLKMIREEGKGIAIYLHQEGRGNGAAAHIATLDYRRTGGITQSEAYRKVGFEDDCRSFRIAAKVIEYFGIKSVRLISSNLNKKKALEEYGIQVNALVFFAGKVIRLSDALENFANSIKNGTATSPIPVTNGMKRVFVVGDLNADYLILEIKAGAISDRPEPKIGGTAFNAAVAFSEEGLMPILFGKVGDDQQGRFIEDELRNKTFYSLIGLHSTKPSGSCNIVFFDDNQRWLLQDTDNANDYDLKNLKQALELSQIGKNDIVFVVAHAFFRSGVQHSIEMLQLLSATGAKLILDIVPHNLYKHITMKELLQILDDKVFAIIAEFSAFMNFLGIDPTYTKPSTDDYKKIIDAFNVPIIVVRHGIGNISHQTICHTPEPNYINFLKRDEDTGYSITPNADKRGFGDRLTGKLIKYLLDNGLLN